MGITHSMMHATCWDDEGADDGMKDCAAWSAHHADKAMQLLLSCVQLDAETIDAHAFSKIEYSYNQSAIYETLADLPVGSALCIGLVRHIDIGKGHRPAITGIEVRRLDGDRFSAITTGPTSQGWPSWSTRLTARAMAAISLTHMFCLVPLPRMSCGTEMRRAIETKCVDLCDRLWLPTAARALIAGPDDGTWTSVGVARVRLLLRFTADAFSARYGGATPDRTDAAMSMCATATRHAAHCLYDGPEMIRIHSGNAQPWLAKLFGQRHDLEWMQKWLDALCVTPAVRTHILCRKIE